MTVKNYGDEVARELARRRKDGVKDRPDKISRLSSVPPDYDEDPDRTQRLLRGRIAAAKHGRHVCGPVPYGYRRDINGLLDLCIEEARVVRSIFSVYLRLHSIQRVRLRLDLYGCKTRKAKQWSAAGVSWILHNSLYVGRVRFGSVRARGVHEPIVPWITFNLVQRMLKKNRKRA